ncbi:MAG TPA: XrtA/PEP-CTERM system histidine kinase PrsK [Sphingomonas sp.]|jgi:putative PEP-CTERM system histidine kinase|nr:XrtA/PEP-CTERM system histidine kinase PrsK [Sphingomonas sp.]
MSATLIVWGHALAALLFGVLAVRQLRNPQRGWPQKTFVIALGVSALWALAVAGIDPRDVTARVAGSLRNIAWLAFMLALVKRDRAGGASLIAVYVVVMLLAVAGAGVAVVETMPLRGQLATALADTRLLLRMLGAVAALLLVRHLHGIAGPAARGWIRPTVLALATMWTLEVVLFTAAYAGDLWVGPLFVLRGFGMAGVALVFALAAQRGGDWSLAVSRTVAMRSLSIVGLALYALVTMLLISVAGQVGGAYGRIFQAAAVFGTTAALLTLVSTPWLRAWAKVKVAKHLFRHRYDYRAEWQRFTETLGTPGEGAAPLAERIVKAVADLTDSPAGLLLVADAGALEPGAGWNWPVQPTIDRDLRLAQHLAATARIVELDTLRLAPSEGEAASVPNWILDRSEAWAIVPLLHGANLVGAILLARPPIDRALDWEDLDLLRVAGRQAASYLAEDRAHAKLADAARFDEFNRRFAFILHDIKNLVSGLTLVARNAERHADNPEFRADMIATLQDSATRMNALLARLSQHHQPLTEATQAIDVAALALRAASARGAGDAVEIHGSALVFGQPARLEQVLGHLIQNGVEAGRAGDIVLVEIGSEAGRVTIDVVDRGCGMSPAFVRDQLFRPFASSKPAGFGIGAYEARQLVETMGGSIGVDSCEGEGTRFRIVLPAAAAMEKAA